MKKILLAIFLSVAAIVPIPTFAGGAGVAADATGSMGAGGPGTGTYVNPKNSQRTGACVTVTNSWVTATMPGQTTAAVYLQIRSEAAAKLIGVSSPVAKVAQMHEMKMNGNVMQMRAINSLDLPAGKTVEFKPGGYHIMLSEINPPLQLGAMVPLILTVECTDMQRKSVEVKAEVRSAMNTKEDKSTNDMGSMEKM